MRPKNRARVRARFIVLNSVEQKLVWIVWLCKIEFHSHVILWTRYHLQESLFYALQILKVFTWRHRSETQQSRILNCKALTDSVINNACQPSLFLRGVCGIRPMANCLSTFYLRGTKSNIASFTHSHIHLHIDGGGCQARRQPTHQDKMMVR